MAATRNGWRWMAATVLLALLALPRGAAAGAIQVVQGHLSLGYAQLFIADAPGGNLSITGGVDFPITRRLRAGIDLGYSLLGSRAVERGSLSTNVNYSALQGVAFAHWIPEHLGPVGRISLGPALVNAHADLSAAAGGAGFSDLAVFETAPGVAAEVSFISRKATPVRVGLQLGYMGVFLSDEDWSLASARVTIHY